MGNSVLRPLHIVTLIVTVLAVAIGWVKLGNNHPSTMLDNVQPEIEEMRCQPDCVYTPDRFDPRQGPVVYGYPSAGGMLHKILVTGVELQYLGIDRFTASKRSSNQQDEDEFCRKLRRIGARRRRTDSAQFDEEYGRPQIIVATGWPSTGDGVWVLKFDRYGWMRNRDRNFRPPRPEVELPLTLNMDERCEVIKQHGGVFYENPEDCEDLRMESLKVQ